MTPRPFILSMLLIAGSIAAGLLVRLVPLGLPDGFVKHGGSVLWAAMIYWIVSTLRGRWSLARSIAAAMIVAFGIEASQCHHQPALDAFRSTRIGALLLGRVFSVGDLIAYGLAILFAAVIDRVVRPPRRRGRRGGSSGLSRDHAATG